MFKRKLLALMWTIIISTPIIGFCYMLAEQSDMSQVPPLMLFTLVFATPFVIFFGLPMSVLSDIITRKFTGKIRRYTSLAIHLLLAFSFVVVIVSFDESRFTIAVFSGIHSFLLIPAIVYSVVGWSVDEVLRKRLNQRVVELKGI